MQIEAPIHKKTYKHFLPRTKKNCRGYPRQREKYLAGALALLSGKFWLFQKFLGCITYFFPKYHVSYRLYAFFPEMCRGISNRSCNFLSKIIKTYILVISITLAKKNTKSFSNYWLVSGKARNIQDFLKSFSGKVLIILIFF